MKPRTFCKLRASPLVEILIRKAASLSSLDFELSTDASWGLSFGVIAASDLCSNKLPSGRTVSSPFSLNNMSSSATMAGYTFL